MRAVKLRRRRSRGQALAEIALAGPLLLVLLVGSAQVGVIAYGNVTMDTAAREGARIASEAPVNATNFSAASSVNGNSATFNGCSSAATSSNYAVQAVCRNVGILDTSKVSVTITKNIDVTAYGADSGIHLASFHMGTGGGNCTGGYKLMSGTVDFTTNNVPSGTTATIKVSGIPADTGLPPVSVPWSATPAAYSYCIPPGGSGSGAQPQTATALVTTGCTQYSDSQSNVFPPATVNFVLALTQSCPQPITTTTQLTVTSPTTPTPSTCCTSVTSGQQVTFYATVTPASGSTPGGSVTFTDTSTIPNQNLATVTLTSGSAQFSTSTLNTGPGNSAETHTILATYNPDGTHVSSTSNYTVAVTVNPSLQTPTTTLLAASPTTAQQGVQVTLSALVAETVGSGPGTVTGSVTFSDIVGGTTLTVGVATISSGIATLTTNSLPVGGNYITAAYGGDANNAPSTSQSVTVTITSSGSPGGGGIAPGPNPLSCTDPPQGLSSMYLQIDVTYPVPIFVPLIGGLFSNAPGVRNVTVTQFIRIEPCGLTVGN